MVISLFKVTEIEMYRAMLEIKFVSARYFQYHRENVH